MLATIVFCVFLVCLMIRPEAVHPYRYIVGIVLLMLMFYELIDRQSERTTFANANKDDAKAG